MWEEGVWVEGIAGAEKWRLKSRVSKLDQGEESQGKHVDTSKE